jgi:hypothetical protein
LNRHGVLDARDEKSRAYSDQKSPRVVERTRQARKERLERESRRAQRIDQQGSLSRRPEQKKEGPPLEKNCKERPTDWRPKGGGGGTAKRKFIPWC